MPWTDLIPITKTRQKVWEYINALIGNTEYNKTGGGGPSDLVQDHITKLEVANGADADHDIDFSGGQCADSTNDHYLEATGMTKRIDATWTVGNGNGGLFSGATLSPYTWYYPYIIEADSDDSIDFGFDDNIIGTNVPGGYTHFRKIRGAFLTDASSNILGFSQTGDYFKYSISILDYYENNVVASKQVETVSVPPNFLGSFSVLTQQSTALYVYFQETGDPDRTPSATDYTTTAYVNGVTGRTVFHIPLKVDSSSQIAFRPHLSSNQIRIMTMGFWDDGKYYL